MPFAYYGAKHGLAAKYPRPHYSTIVEPFAGAAGYSCHHATPAHRVILNDTDTAVVCLWRRLQRMTLDDLSDIDEIVSGSTHTTDLLLAGISGSASWNAVAAGGQVAVTPRIRNEGWPKRNRGGWIEARARILDVMDACRSWEIRHGDYRDLPDIEATWFVDPPYQPIVSTAGSDYRHSTIDYDELAGWCQSRRGQVIVCEQSPAEWLPFTPLARQGNGVPNADTRLEVVWLSDQQQLSLFAADHLDTREC